LQQQRPPSGKQLFRRTLVIIPALVAAAALGLQLEMRNAGEQCAFGSGYNYGSTALRPPFGQGCSKGVAMVAKTAPNPL